MAGFPAVDALQQSPFNNSVPMSSTFTRRQARTISQRVQASATERVLRYPSGEERRIRYPHVQEVATHLEDIQQVVRPVELQSPVAQQGSLGVNLSDTLPSVTYSEAQQTQLDALKGSFQVLDGAPFLRSRPLWLLSSANSTEADGDGRTVYTLPTRLLRRQASDVFSQILGRTQADGKPLLEVADMVDGIVAFADEASASSFAELLTEEGTGGVLPAEVDAFSLFRAAREAGARVVYFAEPQGGQPPHPTLLAKSLRERDD